MNSHGSSTGLLTPKLESAKSDHALQGKTHSTKRYGRSCTTRPPTSAQNSTSPTVASKTAARLRSLLTAASHPPTSPAENQCSTAQAVLPSILRRRHSLPTRVTTTGQTSRITLRVSDKRASMLGYKNRQEPVYGKERSRLATLFFTPRRCE